MNDKTTILKCLVGSRAHNLHLEGSSDFDYKSVFIVPTSSLLTVGTPKEKATQNVENSVDAVTFELFHFIELATKSNPSILEVFKSPVVVESIPLGLELRNLFSYVWTGIGVKNAYLGFSHDQRKRWFDDREAFVRRSKYAVAHIRTLLQGIELLTYGDFSVKVKDFYLDNGLHLHLPSWASYDLEKLGYRTESAESWNKYLFEVKQGNITKNNRNGGVFDTGEYLKQEFQKVYDNSQYKEKQTDLDKINEFILRVRKENW